MPRTLGLKGIRLQQKIDELLDFAALGAKRDAHITTLSGGMLRRLSLIRALLNEPELLILDEPTTGLDPQARQLIWQRLRALRANGMALVLTTHYMEEAERLCDRVTVMDHGRILDTDTPKALIRKYIEPQVIEVHGVRIGGLASASGPGFGRAQRTRGGNNFLLCSRRAGIADGA